MSTKVYGASDDLIEFDGDISGEFGKYDTSEEESVLLVFSDGTILSVWYGKNDDAIWAVTLVNAGSLFERIDLCTDSEADPYSDVAHFRDGLKFAYAATDWERVR